MEALNVFFFFTVVQMSSDSGNQQEGQEEITPADVKNTLETCNNTVENYNSNDHLSPFLCSVPWRFLFFFLRGRCLVGSHHVKLFLLDRRMSGGLGMQQPLRRVRILAHLHPRSFTCRHENTFLEGQGTVYVVHGFCTCLGSQLGSSISECHVSVQPAEIS